MAPTPTMSEGSGESSEPGGEGDSSSEKTALGELSAVHHKFAIQSEVEGKLPDGGTGMVDSTWYKLDDDVQEKIIGRLPFKSLFRAASLSETWKLKFRSVAFRKEVQDSSATSWKSYAPLYLNYNKDLIGYESSSDRWHVLPNHSYLAPVSPTGLLRWSLRAGAGALFCWTGTDQFDYGLLVRNSSTSSYDVYVTNPLTKTLRQLPPRYNTIFPDHVRMVCEGTEAYKVMLGTLGQKVDVQVFDSKDSSWTLYSIDTPMGSMEMSGIYVDGVLYLVVVRMTRPRQYGYSLLSFDVEHKIPDREPSCLTCRITNENGQVVYLPDLRYTGTFLCGSKVMLVAAHRNMLCLIDNMMEVYHIPSGDDSDTISVFQLDLVSGIALQVSSVPSEMAVLAEISCAASHGEFLYFAGRLPSSPTLVFNVETREWHWLNPATDRMRTSFSDTRMSEWLWTPISYQPGLNPFLEV